MQPEEKEPVDPKQAPEVEKGERDPRIKRPASSRLSQSEGKVPRDPEAK